jgi:glycosyltransferase involved in cell wall biosynthesis
MLQSIASDLAGAQTEPQLVAVVLTKDEASHIKACVDALRPWVDAVVVWDSGSGDETCTLAQQAGALCVQRPFDNYATQRQAALETIQAEWILFVDADERTTPEVAAEIRHRLGADAEARPPVNGYWLPRRNFIAGRETRGNGYYPDYQLRLLRRGTAHYDPRPVHEIVTVEGRERYLEEPLIHYNYRDWPHFHTKQPGYARIEAQNLRAQGIRPRPHNFILQPLREFRRRYFTLGGWRDGLHGLRLAFWLAWYYGFLPYWLLLRGRA